jgi:hypothetical protein
MSPGPVERVRFGPDPLLPEKVKKTVAAGFSAGLFFFLHSM